MEVERPFGRSAPWRPLVPRPPLVRTCLERDRLRLPQLALIFEKMREPRRQDAVLKVLACGTPEVDVAELRALAGPAAVVPWANHQVIHTPGIVGLEQVVDLHRSVEILLVPPTGHVERRHGDARQIRRGRLLLPKPIVVRVCDVVVPGGDLAVEVPCIDVGERPEIEIPLVGVVAIEAEVFLLLRRLHHRGILEAVAQPEGAIVMEVVAQEHVGGRRLRRCRLERGVRIEHRHHGEPAWVRNAQHAHSTVVVRHAMDQPFDRVVRIGAFVHRARVPALARWPGGPGGPHHDELPLRRVAAADVLKDEDVTVSGERVVVAAQRTGGAGDPVRRAREDERQRRMHSAWDEDRGVQLDAVAHRDHRLGEVEPRSGIRLLREEPQREEERDHAMPPFTGSSPA